MRNRWFVYVVRLVAFWGRVALLQSHSGKVLIRQCRRLTRWLTARRSKNEKLQSAATSIRQLDSDGNGVVSRDQATAERRFDSGTIGGSRLGGYTTPPR